MMKFWTLTTSSPTRAASAAQRAESAGWDGVLVVIGPTAGADREAAREAETKAATEVLPAFD